MKTIVVLMDTLNRRMLGAYNKTWVKTPNIDRLAAKSVVFDNHWSGCLRRNNITRWDSNKREE